MKKIPTLFMRSHENPAVVTPTVNRECAWVLMGEGIATMKWDGTACLVRNGKLFARYDCRGGKKPPSDFEPCEDAPSDRGHWPGWVPVTEDPKWKWHREAFAFASSMPDGTYELVGPSINKNPDRLTRAQERRDRHELVRHGEQHLPTWRLVVMGLTPKAHRELPVTFEEVRDWVEKLTCEGAVWHHSDGRMAKIKRRDFGFQWPLVADLNRA